MHSYFDYRCNAERVTLSMYVEQVCREVIQVSVEDLLRKTKKNSNALPSFLNVDETASRELQVVDFYVFACKMCAVSERKTFPRRV